METIFSESRVAIEKRTMYICAIGLLFVLCASADWSDGHYGTDRTGEDMPGMPIFLGAKSAPKDCFDQCKKRVNCEAWSFTPPVCEDGKPNLQPGYCWLKTTLGDLIPAEKNCRVSGVMKTQLLPLSFVPIDIGFVSPTNWMLDQMLLEGNGLASYLSLFWEDINQSIWIGGKGIKFLLFSDPLNSHAFAFLNFFYHPFLTVLR